MMFIATSDPERLDTYPAHLHISEETSLALAFACAMRRSRI